MKRQQFTFLVAIIAAIIATISVYMIISTLLTEKQEQGAFEDLASFVEQKKGTPILSREIENTTTSCEEVVLPEYIALYEQNTDLFGWIRIDDTPINYPVMHTPNDSQYYLRRAFNTSSSQSGTPFLDGTCFEGCGNLIVYGHHMKNGTMFGTLPKYADKEYWENHRFLFFDTLYEHNKYEIFAAFYSKIYSVETKGFRYYQYTDLTTPSVFNEYLKQVKAAAIYETEITAEFGDELITLSTCNYHITDGRFVVVAKKITEDGTKNDR